MVALADDDGMKTFADKLRQTAMRDVNQRAEIGLPGPLQQVTTGVRLAGRLPGALDYNIEVATQTGSLERDNVSAWAGHWQLREIRTASDRWDRLDVIASAAKVDLPTGDCDSAAQLATKLTTKRARCLVAALFGVTMPSDDVRIKEVSPFGLSIGKESAALVTALVNADFRLARDASGWRVTGFKTGARDWVDVSGLPVAIDQVKRSAASDEVSDALNGFDPRTLPSLETTNVARGVERDADGVVDAFREVDAPDVRRSRRKSTNASANSCQPERVSTIVCRLS